MKMIRYCMVVALAGAIVACSGGGGGSGGGASNGRKPTGYLKADLPQIPQSASVLSLGEKTNNSIQPMTIDNDYAYNSIELLQRILINENTVDTCTGSPDNIPFVLCMIELLGINKPGTYSGQNDEGEQLSVVVTDITGDVDGYELKVLVTNTTRNKIAFKYKATANGKKGIVEIQKMLIFNGGAYADNYFHGISLSWDKTDATNASLTLQSQGFDNAGGSVGAGAYVSIVKARVNENSGVADLTSFDISGMGDTDNIGKVIAKGQFVHAITDGDKQIFTTSKCEVDNNDALNTSACFTINNTNYPMTGSDYKCGVFGAHASGYGFDVVEPGALTGSYGSYAKSIFTNPDCQSLNTDFNIRLDKSSSDGSVVGDMVYSTRSANWTTFNLFGNASWLNAD